MVVVVGWTKWKLKRAKKRFARRSTLIREECTGKMIKTLERTGDVLTTKLRVDTMWEQHTRNVKLARELSKKYGVSPRDLYWSCPM